MIIIKYRNSRIRLSRGVAPCPSYQSSVDYLGLDQYGLLRNTRAKNSLQLGCYARECGDYYRGEWMSSVDGGAGSGAWTFIDFKRILGGGPAGPLERRTPGEILVTTVSH